MSENKEIIPVDFDDTLQCVVKGKSGPELVFNEPLVQLLIERQKKGALIIGFTSWQSLNYGLKSSGHGRKYIVDELEKMGLKLDGMCTSYTDLHVYKTILDKKKTQSSREYLNSLSFNEKLSLVNDFYETQIKRVEDPEFPAEKRREELEGIEADLKKHRDAAKEDLRFGCFWEKSSEHLNGKEQMFRCLLTVLGWNHNYYVFDDNSNVINVAKKLSEEGAVIHSCIVQRMKTKSMLSRVPNPVEAEQQAEKDSDEEINNYKKTLSEVCEISEPSVQLLEQIHILHTEKPHATKAISALYALHQEVQKNASENSAHVANCFTALLSRINNGETVTKEEVVEAFYALDEKIEGPVQPARTVIICTAILGLLGLVIGAVAGALVTSWSGGFGAFAGAVAGGVIGVGLGIAVDKNRGPLLGIFSKPTLQDNAKDAVFTLTTPCL